MRGKHWFAVALCMAPALASANELLNVYQLAIDNDAQLQAARHQRDAQMEIYPQARSSLLPQLNGEYQYFEGDSDGVQTVRTTVEDPNTGETDLVDVPDPFDISTKDETLSVALSQTVFDWGAFQTLKQASTQASLAEADYRISEQSLILRVAAAYFDLLYGTDNLQFANAQKEAVGRQLEQAQKRFEVGLSAITDVQEAQASYDLTVADVISAEQNLEAAKEAVVEIVGREHGAPTRLQADIPLPRPDPDSVDAWVDSAREDNLDLIAARLVSDAAERGIKVARAGHLPTVSFRGSYTDYTGETRGTRFSDADSTGWSYGVVVSVPIFSGGYTRSRVHEAKSVHEQRLAEQEVTERSVERTTRDAYLGVLAGTARVQALKQAVLSNQTALEASETGLQVGTRTAVDVLNAQSQLFSAQRDYARSRYDYLISVLQLKATAGRLGMSDLAEVDALLINAPEPATTTLPQQD